MCKSDYCSHDSDVCSAWWAAGEADEQTQSDVTGDINVLSHYLNDETIFPAQFEINTNILFSDDIVIDQFPSSGYREVEYWSHLIEVLGAFWLAALGNDDTTTSINNIGEIKMTDKISWKEIIDEKFKEPRWIIKSILGQFDVDVDCEEVDPVRGAKQNCVWQHWITISRRYLKTSECISMIDSTSGSGILNLNQLALKPGWHQIRNKDMSVLMWIKRSSEFRFRWANCQHEVTALSSYAKCRHSSIKIAPFDCHWRRRCLKTCWEYICVCVCVERAVHICAHARARRCRRLWAYMIPWRKTIILALNTSRFCWFLIYLKLCQEKHWDITQKPQSVYNAIS